MAHIPSFTQQPGSWLAEVDGCDGPVGVHGTDRLDRKLNAVALFVCTEGGSEKSRRRREQIESAEREGVILLREFDMTTGKPKEVVGLFSGHVRWIENKPWFFLDEKP